METIIKHGDIGTPERHARGELIKRVVDGQVIGRVRKISPIDYYYNRDEINMVELSAGEMMYNYYVTAWHGYHDCTPKERVDGSPSMIEEGDKEVHARLELNRAWAAVRDHVQIVRDVVIDERYIADIVSHWYTRKKMKERLRVALNLIAQCYHIKS